MAKTSDGGLEDVLTSVLSDLKQIKSNYESSLTTEVYPRYRARKQRETNKVPPVNRYTKVRKITSYTKRMSSSEGKIEESEKAASSSLDIDRKNIETVSDEYEQSREDTMTSQLQNRGLNGENLHKFYKVWSLQNESSAQIERNRLQPSARTEREGMYRECGCFTRTYMKKENMLRQCETV